MGDFFNLDNKFFQGLSKVVDCVILSVLWVFCCIPMATTFFLAWQSASVFGWILVLADIVSGGTGNDGALLCGQ